MEAAESRITMLDVWSEFAKIISKRSTCKRRQIGCVLTTSDLRELVAYGYNGNYSGGPNECDNPDKSEGCGCIHSETNALVKPRATHGNFIMFTSVIPCINCAKLIINSGDINRVYYAIDYHDTKGMDLLIGAGIEVFKI